MKRIVAALSLLFLIVPFMLLPGCSDGANGKNPAPSDIIAAELDSGKFPEMVQLNDKLILKFYGLTPEDIESANVAASSTGAVADEVAVLRATDKSKVQAVKDGAEKRAAQLYDGFVDYVPTEIPKIDKHVVKVRGNYVFFVVSQDPSEAVKVFDRFFK